MPQVLLEKGPVGAAGDGIGQHAVERVAAADPRRLHPARGGEVGRPQAHAVHPRAGGRDVVHVLDPLGGLEQGMNQDRPADSVSRFELGQQLVDEVDVPGAFDLGDDHHVDLVARRRDDLEHVVEEPWAIEGVDAHPERRFAQLGFFAPPR